MFITYSTNIVISLIMDIIMAIVVISMHQIIVSMDTKIKKLQLENLDLIKKLNSVHEENYEINYEEIIINMQSIINSLNLEIATKYDTNDERLTKENEKLNLKCKDLEKELEKIHNKKLKKNNRKIKSFNRRNKMENVNDNDSNEDIWSILF